MEEKYKKFLEFDWTKSTEWQLYYSNLYPTPPGNKILTYKKKFYKNKIDPDFDDKYLPPEPSTTSNTQQQSYAQPNYPMPSTTASPILGILEAFVWLIFLGSVIINYHTLKIACVALLIRVIKRTGKPSFTLQYAQLIFLDEHFQLLLYALLFFIDRSNYFTLVPLIITGILNIGEHFRNNARVFSFLKPYCTIIVNKRVQIAQTRSDIEVAIGFFLVIGIFLGLNAFFLPIFYWQYLRFKYIVNEDCKRTFGKMNHYLEAFKTKPSIPSPVKFIISKIQQFASYLGRTEAAPGQAAGGANCNVF
jgi:hypothetical protein